jgi:hypothetical protein
MTMASAMAYASPRAMPQSQRLAQKENCLKYDRVVKPSPQKRIVVLKQFGIKIQIPKNYKTMLRRNGDVSILNPVDYDLVACSARGGFGGRGLYQSIIGGIPNPKNLPLSSLARSQYQFNASVEMYTFSGLEGVLVDVPSPSFRGSAFFVKIPGIRNVVQIGAGCDCDINPEDIKKLLQTISLL